MEERKTPSLSEDGKAKKPPKKAASTDKKPAAKKPDPKPEKKDESPQPRKKPLRKPSPVNGVTLPDGRMFEAGEDAREKGRRGGKRSGEVRKARKTLKQELLDLLQATTRDSDGKMRTRQEKISLALILKAQRGDVRAYESIRDTIGEKQKEQVDFAVSAPKFENLDAAFEKLNGDAP